MWTEFRDADRYYQPAYGPMTEFEAFALTITPLDNLIDLSVARGNMTRLRALTLLDHLPDAASDPGAQNDYEAHAVLCATRGVKSLDVLEAVNEIMGK